MNLLNHYSSQVQKQQQNRAQNLKETDFEESLKKISEYISKTPDSLLQFQPDNKQSLVGFGMFQKQNNSNFIARFHIDLRQRIIRLSTNFFVDNCLYNLKSRDHRLMACRFALNFNSKNRGCQLKINPQTGQILFSYVILVSTGISAKVECLSQMVYEAIERLQVGAQQAKVMLQQHHYFDKFTENQQNLSAQNYSKFLSINFLSDKLAWNTLTYGSKKIQYKFKELDEKIKIQFNNKRPTKQNVLWKIWSGLPTIDMRNHTIKEELDIPIQKFDKQPGPLLKIHKERVDILKDRRQDRFVETVTIQDATYELLFERIRNAEVLKREKQLLKKYNGNFTFGVPTYHIFQKMQNLADYRITNITDYVKYTDWLNRNKETLSIFTKTDVLKQIASTMIDFKQKGVLIHRITADNIRITAGNMPKIYNLGQFYSPQTERPRELSKPNIYLYKTGEGDERYDSYSFGVLMHKTYFGQTPMYVKPTSINRQCLYFAPMFARAVVPIEKYAYYGPSQIMQLCGMFCIKCISVNEPKPENKENNPKKGNPNDLKLFTNVPYMDWTKVLTVNLRKALQ